MIHRNSLLKSWQFPVYFHNSTDFPSMLLPQQHRNILVRLQISTISWVHPQVPVVHSSWILSGFLLDPKTSMPHFIYINHVVDPPRNLRKMWVFISKHVVFSPQIHGRTKPLQDLPEEQGARVWILRNHDMTMSWGQKASKKYVRLTTSHIF